MTLPLIRQGEGIAGIHRIHAQRTAERARLERNINQALTAPDLNSTLITRATAAGDQAKLRGIPTIGRGVQGHIPGTRPDRLAS